MFQNGKIEESVATKPRIGLVGTYRPVPLHCMFSELNAVVNPKTVCTESDEFCSLREKRNLGSTTYLSKTEEEQEGKTHRSQVFRRRLTNVP